MFVVRGRAGHPTNKRSAPSDHSLTHETETVSDFFCTFSIMVQVFVACAYPGSRRGYTMLYAVHKSLYTYTCGRDGRRGLLHSGIRLSIIASRHNTVPRHAVPVCTTGHSCPRTARRKRVTAVPFASLWNYPAHGRACGLQTPSKENRSSLSLLHLLLPPSSRRRTRRPHLAERAPLSTCARA